jgi:hypothetical protein
LFRDGINNKLGDDMIETVVSQLLRPDLPDLLLGGLVLGGICLLASWLIFLILGLLLCVWVYRDAQSRGMSGLFWVLLMLVGSFFWLGWLVVLIIYIIIRKPKK